MLYPLSHWRSFLNIIAELCRKVKWLTGFSPAKSRQKNRRALIRARRKLYLSSRKYARPRLAGGWFSFFMRSDETMSTMIVQMYGSIFRIS